MGLANTTTNLSYARNELIKVGTSFVFDKVGDMIYYMLANNDIETTRTGPLTVGANDEGEDVKFFGDTSGSYWEWDADNDNQNFVNARQNWTTTALAITDSAGNARQLYGQFTAASIESGEHLTALQLRASWAGTTTEAGSGLTGAEIKARADSNSITDTIGQARAIVGNVDAKKATFTLGTIFEGQADVGSGGTIGTLKAFRASLNNSGTVTTGYAFIVETANTTYNWDYGFYCGTSMADIGLYIGSATTGIQLAGTQTTGIVIGSSVTTGISVDSATNSTGTTNGSIHTDGGLGVAKTIYVGEKIRLTGAQTDYILIGTDESTLLTGSAPASPEVWDAVGVFVEVTGTSTRTGSTSNENHAGNFLMQEAGQTYFHFGLQGRAYVASGGTAIEMYGVHGRARILSGGTVGSGSAGGFIGVLGEANNQNGGTVTMGAGTSIYAGVRGLFKNNGTLTAAGKSCAIMAGVEAGTSDCVLYMLSGGGTTSTSIMEINNSGTSTNLLKIQTASGFASVNAGYDGSYTGTEPDASLEVLLGGSTYYLYLYPTEVT